MNEATAPAARIDPIELLRVLALAAGALLIGAAAFEALRRMRGD